MLPKHVGGLGTYAVVGSAGAKGQGTPEAPVGATRCSGADEAVEFKMAQRTTSDEPLSDPSSTPASDDTGSVTFDRYLFQAGVAFPHVLDCALGGQTVGVWMEHHEDLALEQTGAVRWRFIQIKTRDEDGRGWRFNELLKDGISHLRDTYLRFPDEPAQYELHIQGPIARDDLLDAFITRVQGRRDECIRKLQDELSLPADQARDFFEKLRIIRVKIGRAAIDDSCRVQLLRISTTTDAATIDGVFVRIRDRIIEAMRAQNDGILFPECVLHPTGDEGTKQTLAKKMLDQAELRPLLDALAPKAPALLRPMIDVGDTQSALVEKLRRAGASDEMVVLATTLRANASWREKEFLAGGGDPAQLDDLQLRLLSLATPICEAAQHPDSPATHAWSEIGARLHAASVSYDPNRIFGGDPDFLMGHVCELSDRCKIGWRPS